MYLVEVNEDACIGCGECASNCPVDVFEMVDGKAQVGENECIGCQTCVAVCPSEAVTVNEY